MAIGNARADEDELGKLSLEQLMDLPVEAPAKLDQPVREAPGIGAVVTHDQIDLYGWDSLNDLLYRQPGFAPAQDYERPTVSARGLYEGWNNNRLLVLVDGVPFNNVTNGIAYTWEITPLTMLDSVEIIRGPGSALYGTNATNGVLELKTRSAGARNLVEGRLRLGNAGTLGVDVFGAERSDWLGAVVAFDHRRTDGNVYDSYDASGRTDASGQLERFAVKDRQWSYYGFLKLDGRKALDGLSLQLHLQAWRFETGQGWLYIVPDEPEHLVSNRELASLSYRRRALDDRLESSFVLQWQRHENFYHVKYYPDGYVAGGTTFPGGNLEIADYTAHDLFARAQVSYRAWRNLHLLTGVENQVLLFVPDTRHESNVDLNQGGTGMPFPNGELNPLRDVYEPVVNRPIDQIAGFAQVSTGNLFDHILAATLGLRFDAQLSRFQALDRSGLSRRTFSQWSPRAAVVVFAGDGLSLKALAERAFRAPNSIEEFASNTYLAAANPETIKPEVTTTYTLAADYAFLRHFDLRVDAFHEKAANQIAFSSSRNFSANLYTRRIAGVEAELLFEAPLASGRQLTGFANYTFVHLLGETVVEPSIVESNTLTWGARQVWNLGAAFSGQKLDLAVDGHFQGRVARRPSDYENADGTPTFFSAYRPRSVAPWFTLDAHASYRVTDALRVGISATNLLDTEGYLVKPQDYPFDFRIEGRRVMATLEYDVGWDAGL